MTEGSPDYTNAVRLLAIAPDGSLITLAADAAGRLIAALYGAVSIDGPIDVNQTDLNRTMKGADGATLRTIVVDSDGRIVAVMTGNYGGTPTSLAVDASGNIIAVMQGDYAGTLKTFNADAAGNLTAVVQDAKNIFGEISTIGLQEHAVRLGSVSTFERRGAVMWFDRFESGKGHWAEDLYGADAAIALTNEDTRHGGYSVKLTAGADAAGSAMISHREVVLNLAGLFGVEFSFRNMTTVDAWLQLNVCLGLGANNRLFGIRWNPNTKILRVLDEDTWTTVDADARLESLSNSWASIKLVVDGATGDYVRLYAASKSYDLTAYSGDLVGVATGAGISVGIVQYGLLASNAVSLVDDIIITSDEPAS
jgi:hypothetical protein